MKIRVKEGKEIIAHKGGDDGLFLHKKSRDVFDVSDGELLQCIGNDIEIIDHYPPQGEYSVKKGFGNHKAGDIIMLFSDQASRLVLNGTVEPMDESLWRPGRELPKSSSRSFLGRLKDALV
jgi:hypothetical protein